MRRTIAVRTPKTRDRQAQATAAPTPEPTAVAERLAEPTAVAEVGGWWQEVAGGLSAELLALIDGNTTQIESEGAPVTTLAAGSSIPS